jgi:hypothetical protein
VSVDQIEGMPEPMGLPRDQRVLVHQIHPAKLMVDIGTSVMSDVLLWRRRLIAGLVVRYMSPALGSALVLRFADVDRLSMTRTGQYALTHMPPSMMAVRLTGDTLTAVGAWKHRPAWIALGALLIVLGWSHGLLPIDKFRLIN